MHDYRTSPTFCEYAYAHRESQRDQERSIQMIEQVTENVSGRLIEALYDLFESTNTDLPKYTPHRETAIQQPVEKKNKKGGISI